MPPGLAIRLGWPFNGQVWAEATMRHKLPFPIIAIFSALMVSACTSEKKDVAENAPQDVAKKVQMTEGAKPAVCDTQGLEALIGKSKEALSAIDLPQNTRIIEPGTMVTRDYRRDRVNIDIDEAGIISKIWCG